MENTSNNYPNDALTFLADIRSRLSRSRAVTVAACVLCALAVASSLAFAYFFTLSQKQQIYVIDQGSVLSAFRADGMPQKDLEIRDHVTRFHQLFYNVAPNVAMIRANVELALQLGDESVYDFFADLKEKQYYARLVNANIVQQIQVDSVAIDMNAYPYRVHTYCSLYLLRESNITRYDYQTTCEVVDVPRSAENPHGLLIRRYLEVKNEVVGTRKGGNTL